ncbi:MAG: NAD(P)-dependent oxidoreductase [Phyllobacterium sp.]
MGSIDSGIRDIKPARLDADAYGGVFSDLHPPLTRHEALVEADRCYFCYDAPCMNACPTGIDIPMFIRQIAGDNPNGSARTILSENILGGMCARVCPTETLCEQACVREAAEGKPVKIGLLQRYSTDHLLATGKHPFTRAAPTGKHVAVVGAGPAGLAAAHRLAMHGHDVTIFEARPKGGGLNEYGIAAYKSVDGFAQKELAFLLQIGGITVEYGKALGRDISLDALKAGFDAVFLGIGLPKVNGLGLDGEDAEGCIDAVDYIAKLRQSDDLSTLPVGRDVVVIGGGMTAIDIAIQTKLLGAENVTIAYRRGQEQMNASPYEQELAQTKGVAIRHWLQPKALLRNVSGEISGIELEYTKLEDGRLVGTGENVTLPADQLFKAIGQAPDTGLLAGTNIALEKGRIKVDDQRRTSVDGIWAGGDCVAGGEDLTVASVQDGKLAADSMHNALIRQPGKMNGFAEAILSGAMQEPLSPSPDYQIQPGPTVR